METPPHGIVHRVLSSLPCLHLDRVKYVGHGVTAVPGVTLQQHEVCVNDGAD